MEKLQQKVDGNIDLENNIENLVSTKMRLTEYYKGRVEGQGLDNKKWKRLGKERGAQSSVSANSITMVKRSK